LRQRLDYAPDQYGEGYWELASETRYIYDGWRVIQERDGGNNPTVSYTRGRDLSGTMEGAGGIGGNWGIHNCYFADGNGNITYMLDANQAMVAKYRYDPFGSTISSSGSLRFDNLYRFSSKEIHVNSGMYYYLYRFYDPNLQRWINRDPLTSSGDYGAPRNLYRSFGNDPLDYIDGTGMATAGTTKPPPGLSTIICQGGKAVPRVSARD